MSGTLTNHQKLLLVKHRRQIQQRIARGELDFFQALDAIKTLADPDHEAKGQVLTLEMRGMIQMVFDQLEGRLARGLVDPKDTLAELDALSTEPEQAAPGVRSVA